LLRGRMVDSGASDEQARELGVLKLGSIGRSKMGKA